MKKLLALFILLIVISCQKDDIVEIEETLNNPLQENDQIPIGDEMIIGKKKNNPYSIENLNKARVAINENLGNKNNKGRKRKKIPTLNATHLYIKFTPTTKEHCETLLNIDDNGSMTLHAYPLDSEIIQEGTTPLANNITNPGLNELYAVIPIGDPIPNVPYEILDRIIPEPESELLEAVSFLLTDNSDELAPGMTIDKMIEMNQKSAKLSLFGSKWTPRGNLLIYDTHINNGVGLRKAKVSIGRWFKWTRVDTDNNGTFVSNKTFRSKKVRVRTKWRSNVATIRKSWNEILGIAVSDHAMTVFRSSNNPTRTISTSDEHLWYKGTVHNGLVKVNDFFEDKGMSGRLNHANIWVHPGDNHRGAALMLKKYTWTVSTKALFSSWWTWIGTSLVFPTNIAFSHLYPDISLSLGRGTNTKAIDQLVFHESAHYMHALKTEGSFWGDVVQAEANNILNGRGSYGNGTQPTNSKGELIALAEGWATFIEYRMMDELYGAPFSLPGRTPSNIENYTMFTRPNSQFELDDEHWFLSGLFWDLYDTNGADPLIGDFVSLLSGVNGNPISTTQREELEGDYQPIYDLLDRNTRGANDLENRIISAYPVITQRTINTFNAYGY